jgi:enoyl-[acyl-carrier protein] reductase II
MQIAMRKLRTDLTDLLGTRFPIVQGGMIWVSGWRLAAAVSAAGGLGLIGAGSMDAALLAEHIGRLRAATGAPFGVNVPLTHRHADACLGACLDAAVPAVFTSAGTPRKHTARLREAGIKVAHVVPSAALARKAWAAGCDAVVAEGTEAGGHNGFEELTSLCLWPAVARAVSIPVIAAGGVADGRGLAAALALGCAGVQVGTRFALTGESSAHPDFKRAALESGEGAARLYLRRLMPTRALSNAYLERVLAAEAAGAGRDELLAMRGPGRSRKGIFDGDLDEGELEIGQVAGRITDLPSAADVVARMIEEYREVVSSLPIAGG